MESADLIEGYEGIGIWSATPFCRPDAVRSSISQRWKDIIIDWNSFILCLLDFFLWCWNAGWVSIAFWSFKLQPNRKRRMNLIKLKQKKTVHCLIVMINHWGGKHLLSKIMLKNMEGNDQFKERNMDVIWRCLGAQRSENRLFGRMVITIAWKLVQVSDSGTVQPFKKRSARLRQCSRWRTAPLKYWKRYMQWKLFEARESAFLRSVQSPRRSLSDNDPEKVSPSSEHSEEVPHRILNKWHSRRFMEYTNDHLIGPWDFLKKMVFTQKVLRWESIEIKG
jgi:hypothetical protein